MKRIAACLTMLLGLAHGGAAVRAAEVAIDTPMPPPAWALLERQLLAASTAACREFFARYFDARGYLLAVERWGSLDGADDAPENMKDWPLLYALGAPEAMLRMFEKGWEGHLRQYTAAKQKDVPFAREGMYHKEFHVVFDQAHIAEGLWAFYQQALADPYDAEFQKRSRRFAGFYLNEDPGAPNYDAERRIIKSLFTGSRGPLLRPATPVDWAGDPVETGRFTQVRGERSYADMLGHFKDYGDIVGDHPVNLMATMLALNAYTIAQEAKYKNWLLEYVDAWAQRMADNQGIIPSKVGLDGRIGGPEGKWYGGAWGWGFSVKWPQTGDKLHHLNNSGSAIAGFGNAFLLTGERRYLDVWRRMLDTVNGHARVTGGVTTYPHSYGDQGWYNYTPDRYAPGAFDLWYWTMTPEDRSRVPLETHEAPLLSKQVVRAETEEAPWLRFLEGSDPDYPARALQADFATIRSRVAGMRADPSTPDTRVSEGPMKYNPATARTLTKLMLGGRPNEPAQPLYSALRYFDPVRRRSGVPGDVAALVEKLAADEVVVTLVNVNPVAARTVVVQAGAYAEHRFAGGAIGQRTIPVDGSFFTVRLEAGCGSRMALKLRRYVNPPTVVFPWDRTAAAGAATAPGGAKSDEPKRLPSR